MKDAQKVVVVGASAGGVEALRVLASGLPQDFPVPVMVVLHLSRESPSNLPRLLSGAGPLPAIHPTNGEAVQAGKIYVAPPDLHMTLHEGHVRLRRDPRENNTRPAIDPLFRSASVASGPGAIGVVLTGTLYDGSAGLQAIKAHGGIAIVQDPEEAMFSSMPRHAMQMVDVDHCLPLHRIPAQLLDSLQRMRASPGMHVEDSDAVEVKVAEGSPDSHELLKSIARPSSYTCPECHGALWEVQNPAMLRFRCRVGHSYTADALLSLKDQEIEGALWSALRALEERASLAGRMIERAQIHAFAALRERFEERRRESEHHASVLRRLLLGGIDKDPQE